MRTSLSFAVVCRLLANISAIASGFISLRLYSTYLSKDVYGGVLVATSFLTYLPLIGNGFGMTIGREILADQDPDSRVATLRFTEVLQNHLLLLALAVALLAMGLYSLTPTAHAAGLPMSLFLLVGLGAVVTFHAASQMGLLVIYGGKQVYSPILLACWSPLTLLVLWLCFRLGLGVWAMPISTAVGAFLPMPVTWMLVQRRVKGLPILAWHRGPDFFPRLQVLWRPAVTWLQSQVSTMVLFTMDIILMGMLFGPGPVAIYGNLTRITSYSRQFIQTLCDAAWPRLAQEPDPQRKADLMLKVDRLNAWISGSWYGAMAATIAPFLGWLMKADWVPGPLLIALVLARNLIVSLSAPHSYGLLSDGRFKEMARFVQRDIMVSLVALFIVSHYLGMIGVAWGMLIGTLGGTLYYVTYLYFHPFPHTHWTREWCAIYWRGLISTLLGFGGAWLAWKVLEKFFAPPGWLASLAGGVGFGVGMLAALVCGLCISKGQTRAYGGYLKLPVYW